MSDVAYCTVSDLRSRLNQTSTAGDTILSSIILSVSRWIEDSTKRRFHILAETRYYSAEDFVDLWIDDCISISSLKTDDNADGVYETTWAATDYKLLPSNALLDGMPYSQIRIATNGNYAFPRGILEGVQLVGSFGYCSSTTSGRATLVREACLLQAERIFKRKDSPLGVSGLSPLGAQTLKIPGDGLDPDIAEMLVGLRRLQQ